MTFVFIRQTEREGDISDFLHYGIDARCDV